MADSICTRLGVFSINSIEIYVFYNKQFNCIDYYSRNEEDRLVECYTIRFLDWKKFYKKAKTLEKFKETYENTLKFGLMLNDSTFDKYFNIQTFPMEMWEDCVLTDFKDAEMTFIPTIGK